MEPLTEVEVSLDGRRSGGDGEEGAAEDAAAAASGAAAAASGAAAATAASAEASGDAVAASCDGISAVKLGRRVGAVCSSTSEREMRTENACAIGRRTSDCNHDASSGWRDRTQMKDQRKK